MRTYSSVLAAVFVLTIARHAKARQYPLAGFLDTGADQPVLAPVNETNVLLEDTWRFDVEPSPNATHNYTFDTVANLLQQWPNTRYRNGHTLVPATVPPGTLLYHGTTRHAIPQIPEWVAVDPEHSYTFCIGQKPGSACWHLTLATTRELKLLYFDGSSAAKMRGTLDVQDIITWGRVVPERQKDEESRIRDLCNWGEKYGLDGFLRMAMDFEIMLCNFTLGVEPISFLNIETDLVAQSESTTHSLTPPKPGEIWLPVFRGLEAGQWHNAYPGDPRLKLDLARLISFYDTEMFPSLAEARYGLGRWDHRVEKLGEDPEGKERLFERLDEVLGTGSPEGKGSGVDWLALIRVVVHRFADRLEVLRYMLRGTASGGNAERLKALQDAHEYVASMLAAYIIHNIRPVPSSDLTGNKTWAAPVFKHCATTHTKPVLTGILQPKLTYSERLILEAVNGVLHEICRVLVGVWAEGVEAGIEKPRRDVPIPELDWETRVGKLMGWLDWSVWVKCTPACGFEEMCWLPTWPGWPWTTHDTYGGKMPNPDDDYWRRPRPKCMRRVLPLKMVQ